VKLARFQDLVVHHEHQREVDPAAAGRCLAEAHRQGHFELPLFNHDVKQFISRVNVVCAAMPELEFPPFDPAAVAERLARAFHGLTLVKEAQAAHIRDEFLNTPAPTLLHGLDALAHALKPTLFPGTKGIRQITVGSTSPVPNPAA